MPLPKEVEKQEAKADELIKQLYNQEESSQQDTVDTVEEVVQEPTEEVTTNSQKEEVIQKEEPKPQVEKDDFRAQYRTIQGKYNAEVPRLHSELKEEKQAREKLEEELRELKTQQELRSLITPEEKEQYGELEPFVSKVAKQHQMTSKAEVDKLRKEMQEMKNREFDMKKDNYYKFLDAAHPDWESINKDENFHNWLSQKDYRGYQRQDSLDAAHENFDHKTVANIFTAYKNEIKSQIDSRQQGLEQQVAPSKSTQTSAPPAKKIWTRAALSKYYRDCKDGIISDKQAASIEQDIMLAQQEGRIR